MVFRAVWIMMFFCCFWGSSLDAQMDTIVRLSQDDLSEDMDEDVRLAEATLDFIIPTLSYGSVVERNSVGFTGALLIRTKSKNYNLAGIDASYFSLGSLSNTISSQGEQFTDFTRSNYASVRFLYRMYAPFYTARIEPFLEAGLGPQIFYTMTTTTFFDEQSSSNIVVEEISLGLTYGLSAGATIALTDNVFGLIKVGMRGGTATGFLVPRERLSSEYPIDNFDFTNDPLSSLQVSLGVSYSF